MTRFGNELRKRLRGRWCVYCGERAEVDEHFPPASVTRAGYILPACAECNAVASDRYPFDFEARAEFVKERIRDRHPEPELPTTEELLDMEEYEWQTASSRIDEARRVRKRLAWPAASSLSLLEGLPDPSILTNADDMKKSRRLRFVPDFDTLDRALQYWIGVADSEGAVHSSDRLILAARYWPGSRKEFLALADNLPDFTRNIAAAAWTRRNLVVTASQKRLGKVDLL